MEDRWPDGRRTPTVGRVSDLLPTGPRPGRWRRALRRLRRGVLARRRLLAAALAGIAVAAGLRAATAPPPPTVPVLVARHDLGAGTVLGPADLTTAAFAVDTVPSGVTRDLVGRTLAAPLRRGEPVTDLRLVGPALAEGHPGLVAVPVRLPDPGAVALLTVGDRIDVLAADPRAGTARALALDVPVLAIAAPEGDGVGSPLPGRLVVIGVPAEAVAGVAAAGVQDFLSFAFSR